jgi:BASS family bile acid:Na+ symporter
MKPVVDAGVPVPVFFAMVTVVLALAAVDFRRIASKPGTVMAAILGQALPLPVLGGLPVRCLSLQASIARGLSLVAACPGGGMANVYTYRRHTNMSRSGTLTGLSCLAAAVAFRWVRVTTPSISPRADFS